MTMKNFDRPGAREFRVALDKHLANLSQEIGLTVVGTTMQFDPAGRRYIIKIEAKDGESSDRAGFERICEQFGLDKADFGREYGRCKIVGITGRGLVRVQRPDGTFGRHKGAHLPHIVQTLHPGDRRRLAEARFAIGKEMPGDLEAIYPEVKKSDEAEKRPLSDIIEPPPTKNDK